MISTQKRVGITGLNGFLGRHLKWLLSTIPDEIEIVHIPLSAFDSPIELHKAVQNLDVVVHLARIHPKDAKKPDEIYIGNINLAKKLVNALEIAKVRPHLIYGSSTQIRKDNEYGKAKKVAGEIFRGWSLNNQTVFTNLIIPNEFGESGIPRRSSVVSTFCDDILKGVPSQIAPGSEVSLIHCQEVAKVILDCIRNPEIRDIEIFGTDMKVSDLHDLLVKFKESYYADIIPVLKNPLEVGLFNNLRWHIFDSGFYPRKIVLKTDERGSLFEVIKENSGGQTFISTTKPGITRGNHFHTRKIERFCVVKGKAKISLREVGTEKVHVFEVSGNEPVYIDMPTFYTHNIENIGQDELSTIFWSNEIFDQNNPDTYFLNVETGSGRAQEIKEVENEEVGMVKGLETIGLETAEDITNKKNMKKMKVMTIIGTRPEIIKLSEVIKELDRHTDHILVHTGQNYDYELNEIFFKDLGLRKPDYFLESVGTSVAETVANVISKTDKVLEIEKPEAFLVLGDTNSAMGAYSAKRRKIPIFHMEAGNRCFDARVPEEVNRKILDHMSDINLVYSDVTRHNLLREGLPMDRIIKSGSPTYEVLMKNKEGIENSKILDTLNLEKYKYLVMTLHREENVDIKANFDKEIEIIRAVSKQYDMPIIFSCHPRTKKRLDESGVSLPENVKTMKPLGLFDFVKLQMNAFCVITDSGTISEESSMLNFPGVNVRETHERLEAMDEGSVIMSGLKPERVLQAIEMAVTQKRGEARDFRIPPDYSYQNVSKKMARVIMSYTDYVKRVVWSE